MEVKAAALRIALEELDLLVELLADNDIHGPHLDQLLRLTQHELTARLRDIEMQLWTKNGLPEQKRGS